jgi:hypothetical protein
LKRNPRQKSDLVFGHPGSEARDENMQHEVDELKNMIIELAKLQKKQTKTTRKQTQKPSGGTKIVVLPQNTPAHRQSQPYDSVMEALRKSLM